MYFRLPLTKTSHTESRVQRSFYYEGLRRAETAGAFETVLQLGNFWTSRGVIRQQRPAVGMRVQETAVEPQFSARSQKVSRGKLGNCRSSGVDEGESLEERARNKDLSA